MKKQDKIIAIAGVALIIVLAIIAVFLLFNSRNTSSKLVTIVPQVETVDLQETDNEVEAKVDSSAEQVAVDIIDDIMPEGTETEANSKETTKSSVIQEKYSKQELKQIKNDDSQLKELSGYWEEYKLDAVADLIRLERIRVFTKELEGTDQFFYCGEVDGNKLPNGKGLAVYSNDTYYYGEWNKGLREGNGMWLKIYIDEPGEEGVNTGVLEHMYNGEWKADLPNGQGQEHYTLKYEDLTRDDSIANVIGGFKNGYYDGEVYIMTANNHGVIYDWYAKAKSGVYEYCDPNKVSTTKKKPVWEKGSENDHSTDTSDDGFYWMLETDNTGFGVWGLKK